jgi:glutamate-1-semialdehyde aminotransferase
MPIGMVAGRRPIIDTFDGGPWHFGDASGPEAGVTFFAGTFVRHPLAIAAVHATLTRLVNEGPALQERVSAHTTAFAKRANALFQRFEAPYELPHFGSQLYLRNLDPSDLGVLFWYHLRLRGVHIQETFPSYFTVEHGSAEVDRLVQVFEESLEAMADGGFLPPSTSRRKTAKAVASNGISSTPPVPGARLGKDPSGRPAWYAPDPERPGQYVKVS